MVCLAAAGRQAQLLRPGALALSDVRVDAGSCELSGSPIEAAVFRAVPTASFADGFTDEDAGFSSAEARAVWLHLLSLSSVCAINRGDCDLWFVSSEWPVWRRRLGAAGVPLSRIVVGDHVVDERGYWMQWTGGVGAAPDLLAARCFAATIVLGDRPTRSLWCVGSVLDGPRDGAVMHAGNVLTSHGVALASIDVDVDGRIAAVNTIPSISELMAPTVANVLARYIDGNLAGRRP